MLAAHLGTVFSLDSLGKQASEPREPPTGWHCSEALRACGGGAALQEQGVAVVAHAHRLGVGGKGQLVTGARVAEDVATVAAVVLEDRREAIMDMLPWPTYPV